MRSLFPYTRNRVADSPACLPSSIDSRHPWPWLVLSLCFLIPSTATGDDGSDLKYGGKLHDSATVASVQKQVGPLIPEAITSAENLLGLSLDPGRLRIQLDDVVKKGGGRTLKMRTIGSDTITIQVFIEPILRGSLRDTDDILTSLTHEIIHAIVRQHIPPSAYGNLPKWFREGVPHFLLEQGEERLVNGLGAKYMNPYALLGGLERRTHFAEPEIAGYFFFSQMNDLIGHDGLQRFIRDVLYSKSIDGGLGGLSLQELGISSEDTRKFAALSEIERRDGLDRFWQNAHRRARAVLSGYIDEVAQPLFECMTLYFQGRSRNQITTNCFQELIAEFPESYAAEISHYWLAMCIYRIPDLEKCQPYFSTFVDFEKDYGLLDDVRYYELVIIRRSGGEPAEMLRAVEEYLRLFPDAKKAKYVEKMVGPLKKEMDGSVGSE